jgi:hypothetical protein
VVFTVTALLLIGFGVREHRRGRLLARESAQALASSMATTVIPGPNGWLVHSVVSGCHARTVITTSFNLRGPDDGGPMIVPELEICVPADSVVQADVRYRTRDYRNVLRHFWRRAISPRGVITTGDERFDQQFSVVGNPVAAVQAMLDDAIRRELLELDPGFGANRWRLTVDASGICLRQPVLRYDAPVSPPELAAEAKRSILCLCRLAASASRSRRDTRLFRIDALRARY